MITFCKSGCGDGEEECKCHDLAEEKVQEARDEWYEDKIKRLDFINKKLCQKNDAKAYIDHADEAIYEYYKALSKQVKPLLPEKVRKMVNGGKAICELRKITSTTRKDIKSWLAK